MSKLLLDSHPLVVIPELAQKIGLHEAIVLQQINYWLVINEKEGRNFHEGFYWTYNTYEDWQKQFPWWTSRTIKRIILNLEGQSYLISGNFNKMPIDKTKWYRVNYEIFGGRP